jgi:light-regulated signal transduction histidine kinase (bacteriophytochrome)
MNILHLEDNPDDAEIVKMSLKKSLPECNVLWVNTKNKFEKALLVSDIDLVLCDFSLPAYTGFKALSYMQNHKPHLPFILISGTIGEDKTIEIFEAGAKDFILKDNLQRLIPSIKRALQESEEIKKRQLAEQALQASNDELLQFVHIASHDLKAPLIAIDRLSTWIEEDCAEELAGESKKHLQLLRQRVNRIFHLVDAISQYAQASRVKLDIQSVDVKKLLDDLVDALNISGLFSIHYSDQFPVLKTSEGLLNVVFSNLIRNSMKHHHRKKGHIHISAQDSGRYYTFCVTDDGPGIEKAYHEKIFQMFQTLEARDLAENTGMGLSIVKKIVESYGGSITVDSEKGKGATFCFTWLKSM